MLLLKLGTGLMRMLTMGAAVVAAIYAGEARAGEISNAVSFFGDLFAVVALCPGLKVDEARLSSGPRLPGVDPEQWLLIIEEGRRTSPEHIKELASLPQTSVCDYGRKAYGSSNGGYLVER